MHDRDKHMIMGLLVWEKKAVGEDNALQGRTHMILEGSGYIHLAIRTNVSDDDSDINVPH